MHLLRMIEGGGGRAEFPGQNYVSRPVGLSVAVTTPSNDNDWPVACAANGEFPWFHPATSGLIRDCPGSGSVLTLTVVSHIRLDQAVCSCHQ